MITVNLHGGLKKATGVSTCKFSNCHSIKNVLSAIECNFKGFRSYLEKHADSPFKVIINKNKGLDKESMSMCNLQEGDTVDIVPVLDGAGDSWGSVASIIIGIILIVIAWWNPGTWYGAFALAMGTSMTMSGVSQLLFKPERVEPSTYETTDKTKSNYAFNGAVNLTSQGNAVPVGYGQLRVGSQVIGAGLYATNI